MSYKIIEHDAFLEVSLTGETSKYEVMEIIGELARIDPAKSLPDLWVLGGQTMIPFSSFSEIVEAVKTQIPPTISGNKTAFVTSDELQKAEVELYISEASLLGLDMRIFEQRDQAAAWIQSSSSPA